VRGPLFWLKAARAPFFTGSLAPIVVGTSLAYYHTGQVNWLHGSLALVALTALHACANLANDYYDHLTGNDEANNTYATPFTGGSRVIQQGLVRPWEMLAAALVAMAIGAAIGLYLVYATGWPILVLGVVGGLTGFFYTAPPPKLGYRGVGEIFIFLDFGVLPVLGAYFVQTGHFAPSAVVASLPTALLILAVLWVNQFQDMVADAAVGKRHGVVRLGRAASARVHVALLLLSQAVAPAGFLTGLFPAWSLLALLGLPLALKASATVLRSHDDLPRLTPANAATIGCHLVTSLALGAGLVLGRLL
jgi:1,4-dihydroxy-2-naphthoate polyprenyltransferase